DRDNRPNERDKNTRDRDVYPGHVFTFTGHRDKNTGEWDVFTIQLDICIDNLNLRYVVFLSTDYTDYTDCFPLENMKSVIICVIRGY
ncbi:MAG: hypothetical protein JEZ14_25170, partial [Marinilabiliaceae bacterium]|nr:hypothetical protein [Marinilabiliaceae bacterium]